MTLHNYILLYTHTHAMSYTEEQLENLYTVIEHTKELSLALLISQYKNKDYEYMLVKRGKEGFIPIFSRVVYWALNNVPEFKDKYLNKFVNEEIVMINGKYCPNPAFEDITAICEYPFSPSEREISKILIMMLKIENSDEEFIIENDGCGDGQAVYNFFNKQEFVKFLYECLV